MEQPAQASVRGFIEDGGRVLFVTHLTGSDEEVWTLPGGRGFAHLPMVSEIQELVRDRCSR